MNRSDIEAWTTAHAADLAKAAEHPEAIHHLLSQPSAGQLAYRAIGYAAEAEGAIAAGADDVARRKLLTCSLLCAVSLKLLGEGKR